MIDIHGIPNSSQLRTRITKQLEKALAPLQAKPVSARVTFSDENGPRGGLGMRCALTVRVPRRPVMRVVQQAATPWRAFDESFATLERQLAKYRERRAERPRRPKKYYVAKRLLAEGLPSSETGTD
jgi:ribosome-associated translation inhibitor RaiA